MQDADHRAIPPVASARTATTVELAEELVRPIDEMDHHRAVIVSRVAHPHRVGELPGRGADACGGLEAVDAEGSKQVDRH